ncbi:Aliphatic sulfonates import ATP-binding protein SsuB [Baekduia alba]|uniref:ABC transporter ATP-binding protein n=1 Tax=Baekduia alba TaxID=2997333 RepID=UPI0023411664|nr:ABC transporter ATP-binding protein [Baekduia alba]WCB96205.1 Aliphatic sulfonates import ATP-binding protein SsuB [Baekduia alba]
MSGVTVRNLRRDYGERTVLRELDLDIAPGEFVALLGKTGCGKTTLLRVLAGLDPATAGTVEAPGRPAVVFQEPRLLPWKRVLDNVTLGQKGGGIKDAARQALQEVGLEAHADAWPLTLSGGEAQRAALARALVREPQLLLLDEPFAALDALTRIKMHALVSALWRRHRPAVLLVTHDVDEALLLADRVIVMADGRIAHHERIEADHPRDRTDDWFEGLRTDLLSQLGVTGAEDAPTTTPTRIHA